MAVHVLLSKGVHVKDRELEELEGAKGLLISYEDKQKHAQTSHQISNRNQCIKRLTC